MRITSLLPAGTDIVTALGLGDDLVGVTFECDVPPGLTPTVGVSGVDTSAMTPAEIDAQVHAARAAGTDLTTLHEGALRALAPDLIVTQDLCRVCAVSTDRIEDALDHLGCRSDVVSLDPHTLPEVLACIQTVADHADVADRGRQVVAELAARLDAIATAVQGRPRPRVAVIEWIDPVFGAGHWIPDLVTAAGGLPVAARPGERSVPTSWEAVAEARPDVVVVAPCGFGLEEASRQADEIAERCGTAAVWAIDADHLIVKPGPGLVDGVEALAAIFHPQQVSPRAEWVRAIREPAPV